MIYKKIPKKNSPPPKKITIQEAGTSHRTGVQLGPCVDIQCLGTSNSRLKGYSSAKWIPTVAVSRPSFTSTFISIFLNMPPLRNLSANDWQRLRQLPERHKVGYLALTLVTLAPSTCFALWHINHISADSFNCQNWLKLPFAESEIPPLSPF